MADSTPEPRCRRSSSQRARILLLLLAFSFHAPLAAQPQEITLDAASSDFDRRNERLIFREVRIQQAEISISADHAESRDLDFSRGSWSFRGNVRISGPMGEIESDEATIDFADHRLTRATAEGGPAQFSRTMPEPENRLVTGTARRIDYDVTEGVLELAGQAVLRDGIREVSGGRLVYRIAEDRLIASADDEGTERVRIVITPPGEEGPEDPDDEDADGAGPP
jgi:lipopolysaccharide export system protein LptA